MDPRRLREETRAEHEATEALMPLADAELTHQVYVRTLEILYPVISSWERWAALNAPESLHDLLPVRKRSHWLSADLAFVGGSVLEYAPQPVDWGAIAGNLSNASAADFEASFLGVLYVLEGSTLGGRYIARQVEAALQVPAGQGNAYFQGHGNATGALWREVLARIAAVPESHSCLVIAAAKRAFVAFGKALEDRPKASLPES